MKLSKEERSLLQEFASVLAEGRPESAGNIFNQFLDLDRTEKDEEEDSDESEKVEYDDELFISEFESIKGIGRELAEVLVDRFGNVDEFADADIEELIDIPGIAEKKAEKLKRRVS